ncbi:MAG: cytidine deaminase [Pirellulaceae bacterium]|nr:cytidine deaminase [Pirellulaceae bacterium]MDP6723245.1 cytidine deaminase [Pirellulaceae bacterium]
MAADRRAATTAPATRTAVATGSPLVGAAEFPSRKTDQNDRSAHQTLNRTNGLMPMTQMNESDHSALILAAVAARKNAYATYSCFPVGAALLATDGRVFTGCNVENVSYGLTMCAERVAIGNAVAHGCQSFQAIAIATEGAASPCGACLQVLAEFCEQVTIVMTDKDGQSVRTVTLQAMLPDRFAG